MPGVPASVTKAIFLSKGLDSILVFVPMLDAGCWMLDAGSPHSPLSAQRYTLNVIRLLSKLRSDLRNGVVKVCHQPVISELENRRVWFFVDGDDDFAVLDSRHVLGRA